MSGRYYRTTVMPIVRVHVLGGAGTSREAVERVVEEIMGSPDKWLGGTPMSTRSFDIQQIESGEDIAGVIVDEYDGDHRHLAQHRFDAQLRPVIRHQVAPADAVALLLREADQADRNDLAGIGVAAALRAMLPYWRAHFAQGEGTEILERDLDDVIAVLQDIRNRV